MPSSNNQAANVSGAIFVVLLAAYLLCFSGTFTSDDEQLLAGGAQTFALTRQLAVMQLYGNTRLQGSFQEVDPALSVIGSWVYEAVGTTGWGSVQAMFLLTPLWTSVTAVLIFLIGLRWGYAPQLAIWPALFYGLGSMAWPYAKTFFRDPLAAIFIAAAWLCLELALQNSQSILKQAAHWMALSVILAGGVLSKNIVIPIIPILGLIGLLRYIALHRQEPDQWRRRAAVVGVFGAAAVVLLARPDTPNLFRSSGAYLVSFVTWIASISHPGFGPAVAGALVSPGKGLVVFAPFTVLVVLSWAVAGREAWDRLLGPTLYLLVIVAAQALFYDIHWTNPQWGPRFLLPSLPGLAVATLPGLAWVWRQSSRAAHWLGGSVLGLGVLTQLPGVLVAPTAYSAIVLQQDPHAYEGLAIWNPAYSAVVGHWQLVLSGHPWALAWARTGPVNPLWVVLLAASLALLVAAAAGALRKAVDRPAGWWQTCLGLAAISGLSVVLPPAVLSTYQADPAYCRGQAAIKEAVHYLNRGAGSHDLVVVQSYLDPFWHCYFNFGRPQAHWIGLAAFEDRARDDSPGGPSSPAGVEAQFAAIQILELAPGRFERVWLVADTHTPGGGRRFLEGWLRQRHHLAQAQTFENLLSAQLWVLGHP